MENYRYVFGKINTGGSFSWSRVETNEQSEQGKRQRSTPSRHCYKAFLLFLISNRESLFKIANKAAFKQLPNIER